MNNVRLRKPKQDRVIGGKGKFPTNVTVEGFEVKYRPKRVLPEVPEEFKQTYDIGDIIWWNGFHAKDYIWKLEGSDKLFLIRGTRKFEIFEIIGTYTDERLMADRYYHYGIESSKYV